MMPARFIFSIALSVLLTAAQPVAAQETPDFRGAPFSMQGGEAVYRGVCQGCHMSDAKGATGAGSSTGRLVDREVPQKVKTRSRA